MSVLGLKRLADQQLITTTNATNALTNPANKQTVILAVKFTNTGDTSVVVSLYRIPDNNGAIGTLSQATHLIDQITLYPMGQYGSSNTYEDKIILEDTNDSFWVKASVANQINFSIDGLQN